MRSSPKAGCSNRLASAIISGRAHRIDGLTDEQAAAIVAAMKDVAQNGLAAALLYRREMGRKDAVDILGPHLERLVAALKQPIARREASDHDDIRMNLGRNGVGHL